MINKFNSIQHFCFTLKAIVFFVFIGFTSQKVSGQDGQYELDGIGGTPQIIGSNTLDLYPAPFLSSKKDTRVQPYSTCNKIVYLVDGVVGGDFALLVHLYLEALEVFVYPRLLRAFVLFFILSHGLVLIVLTEV